MRKEKLISLIKSRASYLSIGLDTDLEKIPSFLLDREDPIFEFNKAIIDATRELCVAYKPNTAFYECYGAKGWESLQKTIDYIGKDHFIIADAKRGDIGNTSARYAKAFFEDMGANAVTVAPYMGEDSVSPFLGFEDKWVILLALTSNVGSQDFQNELFEGGTSLYQKVIEKSSQWADENQLMYVVGATHPEQLGEIRRMVPNHFFLIPGVGAQGGDLIAVSNQSINSECGILVNSSRGIIYASNGEDFAEAAAAKAKEMQELMKDILAQNKII